MYRNSYDEYAKILEAVKATGKAKLFEEIQGQEDFVVIRHDVEFSIERAYQMALLEAKCGVLSTYFIQLGNNAYNALSDINVCKIKEIHSMGHSIGLHYRQKNEINEVNEIKRQIKTLETGINVPIKCFSTHRPKKETKYEKYEVKGLINAYGGTFFKKVDDITEITKEDPKYISDSKFQWNYGNPKRLDWRKVQLNIHPFQWHERECSLKECFDRLTQEKHEELMQTYRTEFIRYKEIEDGGKRLEI